jgi:hypothetical protein
MLFSSIIDEVKEAVGKCSTAFAMQVGTRAVELLANKGLIDPLIGYYDCAVVDDYFIALTRDVKTILRININQQPTFARSRLYEFHINSEGTTDGDEPGLSWSDRGYSPIQDEKKLPGTLQYKVSQTADNGKTCTVYGLDENGREQVEELAGHATTPVAGSVTFHKITRVVRAETSAEAFLWCNGVDQVCAQYYADETIPEYRVIKLSKTAATVRVMFRRHVYAIRTVDDFIPMHSALAVIHACKAVRFFATNESDKAMAALATAEMFLKEEQAAREEHNTIAENQEIQPAIDASIFCREGVIVSDVYDVAAQIFGPVGRRKLFDRITTAVELLGNKGQWDARLGVVDVFTADNEGELRYESIGDLNKGHGYYVLPRHVEMPVAINYKCTQTMPRNRWFEFHLNGDGSRNERSAGGTWDDAGEVCIIRRLPLDPDDEPNERRVKPTYLVAVPDSALDNATEVRIYGFERDSNGKAVEVWRNGQKGWLCPCVAGSFDPGSGAPRWVSVDRITKGESKAFIRLYATSYEIIVEGVTAIPAVPTVPAQPESDTVVVDSDVVSADAVWTGPGEDLVGYLQLSQGVGFQTGQLWQDEALTIPISSPFSNDEILSDLALTENPLSPPWGSQTTLEITFHDMDTLGDFNGVIRVDRVYTAATPEIPGTPGVPGVEEVQAWVLGDIYGMWYPDEVEPHYRMIRLSHAAPKRVRIAYRKRTAKVTSLTEPIHLRSLAAVEAMLRSLKAGETDPTAALAFEATALRYLRDERINTGPTAVGMLQFDPTTAPGLTTNVS